MREISAGIIPVYKKPSEPLFLIIKQRKGHWGFPKGHLESNEDTLSAAKREVKEEVGIQEISIEKGISHTERYLIEKDGKKIQKKVTYFLGVVKSRRVYLQKEEVIDYKWLPYKQALARATFEGSKNALTVLFNKSSLL